MKLKVFATLLALVASTTVFAQAILVPSSNNFVGASGRSYSASGGPTTVLVQDLPAAMAAGWVSQSAIQAAAITSGSTFTIASGCGTPTLLTGGLTAGSFKAGQTACAPVIGLPAAPNGWVCYAWDITTNSDVLKQTAFTTTSCTLSGTVVAADVIVFMALGF